MLLPNPSSILQTTLRPALLSCLIVMCGCTKQADPGPADDPHSIGAMGKHEKLSPDGGETVLFDHQGKGCLNHFWFGGNFRGFENTRIRCYVDGETEASIDMELYLGHGIGFGNNTAPWATRYVGKIGKRNGIFNNYPIPFSKSIRVTAQKAADAAPNADIWWIVRGVENGRVHIGGVELPANARLKLHRVENLTVKPLDEFALCDVPGKGALFQVTIAARGLEGEILSYLEACMRAYSKDSKQPLMLSSGLEDYFLGTYYFDTGMYHTDIAGLTHFDEKNLSFSAYRFHDQDPVFFDNGLRLTCRNGETEHGTAEGPVAYKNPPPTQYTTYAWVYQW